MPRKKTMLEVPQSKLVPILRERSDFPQRISECRAYAMQSNISEKARKRANIVIDVFSGYNISAVAEKYGVSRTCIYGRINLFNEKGIASFEDAPRPGRPYKNREALVVVS